MVKVKEDLTGWVMSEHGVPDSRLTVLRQTDDYVDPQGNHVAMWVCECDCEEHNQVVVRGAALKNGNTLSCGCLHREGLIRNNTVLKKKTNKYNLTGDYGIGWTTNTNKEFYFDLEDYDKIKDYAWREKTTNNGKYHEVVARDNVTKTDVIMAWIIVGKYYDHIDRNPLNNRKDNLRKATYSQNAQNRTMNSNNTSGVIGVNYTKDRNQWRAQLQHYNQKKLYVNCNTKNEAIIARLQAEAKYFGEFAPQRHLFEQYGVKIESKEG